MLLDVFLESCLLTSAEKEQQNGVLFFLPMSSVLYDPSAWP